MANEITVSAALAVNKTNLSAAYSGSIQADWVGEIATQGVSYVSSASTGTQLTPVSVTIGGFFWFRNAATVNVSIGFVVLGNYYPALTLRPGEFTVGRTVWLSDIYAAKATTGSSHPVQFAFFST
jgi:hypothetical protein